MAKILDGKELNRETAERLAREIENLGERPKLVILQVGERAESNLFIKYKKKFAERIGALVEHKKYGEDVGEAEIIEDIKNYNNDADTHGIILQLPLPGALNRNKIINSIREDKDVDGLTSSNIKALYDNEERIIPATARGVRTLLEKNNIELEGKRVVVVGRSSLVGKAVALALINRDATTTICGKYTRDLKRATREAEILVIAAGDPEFVGSDYVSKDQIVVDIGITYLGERVLGDADFANIKDVVGAISPVPGGVGPMTICALFENLLDAYKMQTSGRG